MYDEVSAIVTILSQLIIGLSSVNVSISVLAIVKN